MPGYGAAVLVPHLLNSVSGMSSPGLWAALSVTVKLHRRFWAGGFKLPATGLNLAAPAAETLFTGHPPHQRARC
ncbi:hypothetical protein [Desulfofundulus sp.]|uniref:hypothetical protein n=1 Tax=Desulfofundulus sp. TaxID=2282750 RepID=UPI003C7360F1